MLYVYVRIKLYLQLILIICFRQLIKLAQPSFHHLLGFKGVSLNAPSEASIWTKFCEIDIVSIVKKIYKNRLNEETLNPWSIPVGISKFEMHLSMPTKSHNYYKLAREHGLEQNLFTKQSLPSNNKDLNILEHSYAEGHVITVADLVLYSNFFLISKLLDLECLRNDLPLTIKWYNNLHKTLLPSIKILEPRLSDLRVEPFKIQNFLIKPVPKLSLYKIETKKHKDLNKKLTKQENVDVPLDKLAVLNLEYCSRNENDLNLNFDWSKVPAEVHPNNGSLPNDRKLRKKEQLENLAVEVLRIAQHGDVVVDFCCGTGHLGLLIACLLPGCHIILLDNKEESLTIRGREWSDRLGLKNVSFFQGNINYFNGNFNIGLCLHACGVATDIVLQKCMNKKANFVCTPCCYGAIFESDTIKYPRSKVFRSVDLTLTDYVYLAHCADQTHDERVKNFNKVKSEQGQLCMDVIDTDRKLKAEEEGYSVTLRRLIPETCTPKNRLLVGMFDRNNKRI